ncbi:MFS transporter [Oceanibacterium hippocampi]|uniref:Putative MFS-type transporter YhjX n=1 Tax=Oceanibacterium hippocampi TaxID=745714 RepID=A0A1Y5RZC8_9PROT|nr:MFS transporter [Oceanibacterium hippocampi]SLN28806.1 putative MFS-type transporter YhjX [Oceanibacterium hippocampi]
MAPRAKSGGDPVAAFTVLAICFLLGMLGRGSIETFPVFVLPLSLEFGWERAEVASIYSSSLLVSGLASPVAGYLFDRLGPRLLYCGGLATLGAGMLVSSSASSLAVFYLGSGLMVGVGAISLGNVPNSALLARWFRDRLPMALGVAFSSLGVGALIMLPLAQYLIDHGGWSFAYRCIGIFMLVLAPILLILPWRRLGRGVELPVSTVETDVKVTVNWTLRRAMGTLPFWALFSVFLFTSTGISAVVVQIIAYLVSVGFGAQEAATIYGFNGLFMPVGMLSFGWLASQLGNRGAIALSYSLTLTAIPLLWLLALVPSHVLFGLFVMLFGLSLGSRGPVVGAICAGLFRGRSIGAIFGAVSMGGGIGGAIGSTISGLLHDWTDAYEAGFVFAFVMIIFGSMPFWLVPELKRGG